MSKIIFLLIVLLFQLNAENKSEYARRGELNSLSFFDMYKRVSPQTVQNKYTKELASYGLDKFLYPANAFLLEYRPFVPKNIYFAQRHLNKRLREHKKHYNRLLRQTSKQTYMLSIANKHEKALLLADWLDSIGYDVRVVIGYLNRREYVWLVLFNEGSQYILDPSQQHMPKHFPLSATKPNYHPLYMYNSQYIWENSGSQFSVNYASEKWKKIFEFKAQ